jgi:hypothetical protein
MTISSPTALQRELRKLLQLCGADRPSRVRIATELLALSERVSADGNASSMRHVQYADGTRISYGTFEDGEKFGVEIKTPDGVFKANKSFDTKDAAQRYVNKFVDKANGHELLEKALAKDFKRAKG